ncbi:MAG TPA: tRNA 2-thiouridine(34) synthase MnmA [Solirubrobacteraceae bacterium]|nr:tRNA 2-thiouridine(34) synthase MnmA [Solirubrobacteraceae bacterium]
MIAESPFATHLERPLGRGHTPADAFTGAAGGAACGDLIRISLALDLASPHGRIADAGFDASGCGAVLAAGSATVALVRDTPLLDAARVGAEEIAAELGGLLPAKRHAAELAADALHRALGAAARACGPLAGPIDAATEGERTHGGGRAPAARTLVAMSGGVDSAVAALLTARTGEQVVGVTLELWADAENDAERSCCSAQAVRTARDLAHAQGFPHFSIDLREEFRAGVVDGWLEGYAQGVTPNPCIRCNGSVRLDAMLELAARLGAERLVTGHYARVVDGPPPLLRVARDKLKDQSYALAGLDPASLARLKFPLGDITKDEVREIAARGGLSVAGKPDSQDLCFLAGTSLPRFLARHGGSGAAHAPAASDDSVGNGDVGNGGAEGEGSIVDLDGRTLGIHRGAHTFTVGQRHGLGLPGGSEPLFVLSTDVVANTVTVGPRAELMTGTVAVRDVTLRAPGAGVDGVRVRSHGPLLPCRLTSDPGPGRHDGVEVCLNKPTARAAPGQIACLYEGDVILGYGIISA